MAHCSRSRQQGTSSMLRREHALAIILVIGGVEQNPGLGMEADNILQALCSGCDKNL
jgi:hypothetical protein